MPPEQMSQTPTPTFAPPMDVQGAPPGIPGSDQGNSMATDGQKQQLLDLISKIRAKMSHLDAASSMTAGAQDAQKKDLLKQLFISLQAAGVDITNPESVTKFIEELRAQSPDLAQIFEDAIDGLLGQDIMAQAPQGTQPPPGMPPQGMPPMGMA